MKTKNPIRLWLDGQPRVINVTTLSRDLAIDRSYLSHLMQEDNAVMPGVPFLLRLAERTKDGPNPVTIEAFASFVGANKKRQKRAA